MLAQTSLSGKVTDKEGEPLIFGNVGIYKDGNLVTGTDTDFDGFYSFINLDPGTYDVEVSYVGYQSRKIEGVEVLEGRANHLDIEMDAGSVLLNEITVVAYKVPLIEQDNMTSGSVISRNDIRNLPTRKINSLAAATAGLSSGKGDDIVVRGSRSNHSSNDEYAPIIENPVIKSEEEAVSTFSIDVDRAAYSQVRSYLKRQQLPPVDLVRTEELINYFGYEYAQPTDGQPFSITTELGDCPWNESHQLLHIGIQGENLNLHQAPANNLVFLIDVSGSMNASNKLPLVKKSIGILIENLRPMDRVAIVVYAGSAGLVLPSTSGQDKAQIKAALEKLTSGGSTAGGQGIKLAYQIARENLLEGGNNRVILATDGDFNVGISGLNQLEKLVEKEREKGVSLTVLGFGMGNYKDNRLELLADKGNGNYAFIDNIGEARKMFDTELTGTLYTIAKDVKLQLHFDPKRVVSYRLIGYENRLLNKKDFDDDSKDAGELGAGHTVTALYELELRPGTQTIAEFQLRYKLPRGRQSHLLSHQLPSSVKKLESCSENFRFAASVAGFSLLLRNSANKGNLTFDETLALAKGALGDDPYGYRQEFLELVRIAKDIGLVAEK
ncbi:MAG: VWA domain-containing protein [Saprospiraceae bacterium]|nr:MAG: VWA domain-containing protein [Saprospiraceae bacterium]